jgi:hypothetical protein
MTVDSRPELLVGIDRSQPIPTSCPSQGGLERPDVETLKGELDFICSAATVTGERSKEVAFCVTHLPISLHDSPSLRGVRIGGHFFYFR